MIRVTAIVVSHDGADWLAQSVAALASQSHPLDRVVAVDTGSVDASVKMLRSAGIHVIETERTLGFGDAIKRALEVTPRFDGGEEWLWILHDDCAPAKDALEKLIAAVTDRPQIAVAGPKLRGWHDRKHLLELGVSIATNGARWTGLEYREQDQGQHDDERDVLAVSTAAMLVRRDVFEELGGFDPNLSLFRDDVDFGWRVRTAGYGVLAVPEALAFHGEAAANERRTIDVHDGYLHRPLLLDRRNAAYVLLANASLIYLPVLGIQLLIGSLLRALGYVLVKLPGYALDELGAVALTLIRPQEIFAARRERKSAKLVAASSVRRYLPPRGVQLRLAYERARNSLESYLEKRMKFTLFPATEQTSVLDLNDESLAEEDLLVTTQASRVRQLFTRPLFLFGAAVLFLTMIASRNRFGELSGGSLLAQPSSGLDLIAKYFESWHPISQGSSANSPTWIAIVGFLATILFGNLELLVTGFFILAVPITVWIGYRFAKKWTSSNLLALAAALVYGFSPPILYAVTHGGLGPIVVAMIAPFVIQSLLSAFDIASWSLRKVASVGLIYGLLLAFSPPAFVVVSAWHFLVSSIQSMRWFFNARRDSHYQWELLLPSIYRRSAFLLTAIAVNIPWSLELIAHPSRALLEPGINLESKSALLFVVNPGTIWWLISAAPVIVTVALFRSANRFPALLAIFVFAVSSLLSLVDVAGHGTSRLTSPTLGGALILLIGLSLVSGLGLLEDVIPQIRSAALDLRHIATFTIALSVVATTLLSIIWWIGPGASAPLQSGSHFKVPEFITANASTEERYKSIILKSEDDRLIYYIVRDRELELGDSELIYGSERNIDDAVAGLVTGVGIDSSATLGRNGIRYLFLAAPYNKGLARTIDGIGGFTRASSTDDGIVWKVVGASSRVSLAPFERATKNDGLEIPVPSNQVSAEGSINRPGIITLAERFDGRWKLYLNNQSIPLVESIDGLPQFEITEPGDFLLIHDGTARRGWISLQFIFFVVALILAAPARRRRSDVPMEELA